MDKMRKFRYVQVWMDGSGCKELTTDIEMTYMQFLRFLNLMNMQGVLWKFYTLEEGP